ncbi:MAG: hypothetical protein JOZ98_17900 [Solirubrobacterales bacterium]|nr:hypothetical protein [Solirubrobacterales bacterium]MBV9797138.1 hypothetical protein [Solirubrobacterales bacterium]
MRATTPLFTIAAMTNSTIRLVIELDLDSDPISGTLQPQPDGETTQFAGWLQLTQALETARRSTISNTARACPGDLPQAQ